MTPAAPSPADDRDRLLALAAQLSVAADDGPLERRMTRTFPWMLALSNHDQATCAQNLLDAARATLSTGQPHLALAELTSWRETATAIAAGLGQTAPDWLELPDAPAADRRPHAR